MNLLAKIVNNFSQYLFLRERFIVNVRLVDVSFNEQRRIYNENDDWKRWLSERTTKTLREFKF